MPLDPFHMRLRTLRISLVNQRSDRQDQVLIHHRFMLRCRPVIFLPVNVPDRRAVDGVIAVGIDVDIPVPRHDFKSTLDRC